MQIPADVFAVLQTAATRAAALTTMTKYGVWAHNPNSDLPPLDVARDALSYLHNIFPINDTTNAESIAAAVGSELFRQDPTALSQIRDDHTKAVLRDGLIDTIKNMQAECTFGFTQDRCVNTFADDPDFLRLLHLARDGAGKDFPDDFIRQPDFLPPRPIHLRVLPAVQWHAVKMARDKQAILLSKQDLPEPVLRTLHHSNITWQAHPEKPLGRFCNDNTTHESGHPLNSPWSKEAADARWGTASCPTTSLPKLSSWRGPRVYL